MTPALHMDVTPNRVRSIMIVDDDEDDIFLFKRLLARAGITQPLVVMLDGAEAITFFQRANTLGGGVQLPGICFLDIKMPVRTGFDVLSAIRTERALDWMPVVMLSSSGEPRDVSKAATLGAQGYFVKHPAPEALRDVIAKATSYADGQSQPVLNVPANLLASG